MIQTIFYIIGVACFYHIQRFLNRSAMWTKKDRAVALALSLSSWVGIAVAALAYVIDEYSSIPEKPAKW